MKKHRYYLTTKLLAGLKNVPKVITRFQEDFGICFFQKAGPGVGWKGRGEKRQGEEYNLILLPDFSIDKLAVGRKGDLNTLL